MIDLKQVYDLKDFASSDRFSVKFLMANNKPPSKDLENLELALIKFHPSIEDDHYVKLTFIQTVDFSQYKTLSKMENMSSIELDIFSTQCKVLATLVYSEVSPPTLRMSKLDASSKSKASKLYAVFQYKRFHMKFPEG